MMSKYANRVWEIIPLLAAVLSLSMAGRGLCRTPSTVLENIRIGSHAGFERMVFDLRGDRPCRITPLPDGGIVVELEGAESTLRPEQFTSRLPSSISGMTFERKDDVLEIKIMSRGAGASASHFFMPASPSGSGAYRLVVDFRKERSVVDRVQGNRTGPPAVVAGKDKRKSPSPPPEGPSLPPAPGPATLASAQPQAADPVGDPLYQLADQAFLAHRHELAQFAPVIIDQYVNAIKTSPKSPQIPLALYRCGLTYLAVDDYKRAEESFKRMIGEYPNHPSVGLAWLGMGKICHHKRAYPESVMALRTALNSPLEKADRTEALYYLGHDLSLMNSHAESIDTLVKCLAEDPTFYHRKPDVLRIMGEAYYGLKQYEKSGQYLLWYYNLQKDAPDQDLILARIAETLSNESQGEMAKKVYGYIKRIYPGSEGEAISDIRKAELLEQQQDEKAQTRALEIYKDLSQKNLPPSLSRLVTYRLAAWEWRHKNYENSLFLIEAILSNRADKTALDECLALKDKVLLDWAKQAYEAKDHARVLGLYKENTPLFQSQGSIELDEAVAESYGEVRAYPDAIAMYQGLLKKTGKNNENWLFRIADYFFLMGNAEKAVQTSEQIKSDSLQIRKNALLAKIYFTQGRYKEAVQNFDRIFQNGKELDIKEIEAVLQYAEGLLQVGRYEDGVACALSANKQLGDNDPESKVQLSLTQSKCHQKLKQTEKAIEALETALPLVQSEPLRDRLNYQLSGLYMEINNYEKATERLTQLSKSTQPLWKVAAQQQLSYIQMLNSEAKAVSF